MNSKTKRIFVLTSSLAVISGLAVSVFYYIIAKEADRLEEQVQILTENNTKESAYVRMNRLVEDTEEERERLAGFYFKNEGDSIAFLGETERLARELGIAFKTEALDKVVTKDKQEFIKMSFAYEGRKSDIFTFAQLFEALPYHTRVESLKLRQLDSGNWAGNTTIQISIN